MQVRHSLDKAHKSAARLRLQGEKGKDFHVEPREARRLRTVHGSWTSDFARFHSGG